MKKNKLLSFLSALCFGLVSAVPKARAVEYPRTLLDNNPNATRVAAQQAGSFCYRIPRTINASRGDIVFSSAPSGVLKSLLSSLGQTFTHTGMALSSSRIRHNTMDPGAIERVGRIGVLVPHHFNTSGSKSVRDGHPGIITQSVNDAYVRKEFHLANGLVMTGPDANRRSAAASQIEQFNAWYRLYAYTDAWWQNPYVKAYNDGNMCSGTVAGADVAAGSGPLWGTLEYSANVRNSAAAVLYDAVRSKIINGVDGFAAFITIDDNVRQFATNGANQIVNCMAFNDCGNTGTRWRNGVGTGWTISPDDVIKIQIIWAALAASQGVPNPSNYQSASPVTVNESYYCCTNPPNKNDPKLGIAICS